MWLNVEILVKNLFDKIINSDLCKTSSKQFRRITYIYELVEFQKKDE